MSAMNDLDLNLQEAENLIDQTKEAILSLHELLSSNEDGEQCDDERSKRDPVEDKLTVRKMLAKKSAEGYTAQVKALLQKFGAEKLSDVDPKDYEDLYYSAAAEGTAAHALGEYKIHRLLGDKFKRPTSDYQSDEMESLTDDYASYVMEQYKQAKEYASDATIRVEQKLDFSKYVPEGFGTGDCVIVSDHLLQIIDFKYGKGVRVKAKNNPQMKLYAIGALEMFGNLYNVDKIETTIFQPRMANISTWTINAKQLMHWANTELKQKAELAFTGKDTIRYGPWCQFSACNAVLRARYDYHHKLTRFQLCSPNLLTDKEVTEVLEHIDDLNRWAHEVKDYAADLAINHGKQWPGYKIVRRTISSTL